MPVSLAKSILLILLAFFMGSSVLAQEPEGEPVRCHGQIVLRLLTPTQQLSAVEESQIATQRIESVAADRSIRASDFRVETAPTGTRILARDQLLLIVTDAEAAAHKQPRDALARKWAVDIRDAVENYRATTSVSYWLRLVALLVLYTLLFLCSAFALARLQRYAQQATRVYTRTRLERRSRLLSIFSAGALLKYAANTLSVARWVVTLLLLNLYLNYSIQLFPGTEEISRTLGSYLLVPLVQVGRAIVLYLPDLFLILVIVLIAHYLIRLNRFFFAQIARGTITIEGFYTDWAEPTANVIRFLIILLTLVVVFPYLPGAKTPIFQGISIFVGILFSLGSSSTVSNVVNGVVLTYMRAFQVGDRVKMADTVGDVIEKDLLVTRIRTIRNEVVTVPNSLIMATPMLNYSAEARHRRLILYTSVTIGYDVPWRQVHELLLAAGRATPEVMQDPPPIVRQRSLNDYNVEYELNVHIADAHAMLDIYSTLHGNIQDEFNRAGVEIMSPAYTALRDGNTVTIPPKERPADYQAPGFRIQDGSRMT